MIVSPAVTGTARLSADTSAVVEVSVILSARGPECAPEVTTVAEPPGAETVHSVGRAPSRCSSNPAFGTRRAGGGAVATAASSHSVVPWSATLL